jgi:mannosidase alpha-like ER degradation enhancer 2
MNDLERAPGIGPSLAQDLRDLGVRSLADLRRRDPERLYDRLNRLRGVRQDPCVLYAFRCAAYFARTPRPRPHLLKWWNWKDKTLGAVLLLAGALGGCAPAPSPADPMAATVRDAFVHAWSAYERYAWGHDEVRPLSRTPRDWHDASLLMTPVDAFDTMLLMGLDSSAARAKELILERLSFDRDFEVQVFEVTIRLLGGLLAAYQLDGDGRFLALARDLGDRLMPAFASATGMPYRYVHLRTGARRDAVNNPAEIGTLMLEFGTLSRLTGDARYYDAAKRATVALFERRSGLGLVGTTIDVETGEWRDRRSHMTGRIDSYYEYLLKAWRLFDDADFARMWQESIAAANRHLADERPTGLWYGHVDMDTGARVATRFGALDAFLPAVLALGGDTARAGRLMESVYRMWTTFGIEPEQLDYVTMEPVSPGYVLRPEAIESAYYLYRLTGEARYREMGRVMVDSVLLSTRAEGGYASLHSVVTREQADRMESFFLAETLKYAYLLFAPAETLDLEAVVFNTEAHPLRRTWDR